MKLLHTSDWHLGQNFMTKSRQDEHLAFLEWLVEFIDEQKIDLLVVAGDIFDTATPPNYALESYFNFLTKVSKSSTCRNVVIVGGNHDSVATLKSSKQLLKYLHVEVVTGSEEEDELIPIYDDKDNLVLIVCAVPFLRDAIVRKSVSGETLKEKEKNLAEGIKKHYEDIYKRASSLKGDKEIPIIATGHLTTVGATTSESEREIYIGGALNINSKFLASMFDYTALGHLHVNQKVGENVWYSGSPIPLSFSEVLPKMVNVVDFDKTKCSVMQVEVPLYRELKVVKGNLQKILEQLSSIEDKNVWIEVHLDDENKFLENDIIYKKAQELGLDILALKVKTKNISLSTDDFNVVSLEELTPFEVFQKRLQKDGLEDLLLKEKLIINFKQILDEVN